MNDDFKTITFRVDLESRTASLEGPRVLHYGDSLKLVFTGLYGCRKDSLTAGFISPSEEAYSTGGLSFSWVPGSKDAVYTDVSLDASGLASALDGVLPGSSVPARFYLSESGAVTWVDMPFSIMPSPLLNIAPAEPEGTFVPRSALIGLAGAVAAMPTLTPAQREARFQYLLTGLSGL